jgi:hypothetical protein
MSTYRFSETLQKFDLKVGSRVRTKDGYKGRVVAINGGDIMVELPATPRPVAYRLNELTEEQA